MTRDDITPVLGPQDDALDDLFPLAAGTIEGQTATGIIPAWVFKTPEFQEAKDSITKRLTSVWNPRNYRRNVTEEEITLEAAVVVVRNRVNALERQAAILQRIQYAMEDLSSRIGEAAA